MSKDILVDVDTVQEHPNRINKLIDRIVEEIEAVRREGHELYTLTMQAQQECNNHMDDLHNQYREEKSNFFNAYPNAAMNPNTALKRNENRRYQDSQESDFYSDTLKRQYAHLENRMNRLNQSKDTLDSIAEQVVSIRKTADDIKQSSEYWNKIFTVTINGLADLNNRG